MGQYFQKLPIKEIKFDRLLDKMQGKRNYEKYLLDKLLKDNASSSPDIIIATGIIAITTLAFFGIKKGIDKWL